MSFPPRTVVVAYLREPQEKVWGVLRTVEPTGFVIQGIPLSSFDDWVSGVLSETGPSIGLSTIFYPLHRLEKILLDENVGGVPSLQELFHRRVGFTVQEHLHLGET